MNKALIIFLLFTSSLLCGCKKWIELKETTIKSVTINNETYQRTVTYRPILGSHEILPFDFSVTSEIGMYQFYIYGGPVINFIIKCQYKDFVPPKKYILQSPSISPDLLYTLVDEMWTPEILKYIPEDSDGIAFMYEWRNHSKRNPIGLSGYLELQETTEGYNKNTFELVCDSVTPIIITEGFFLTP